MRAKMKYICKKFINHQIKKCLLFRCRHAVVIMQTLNWTNQCPLFVTVRQWRRQVSEFEGQTHILGGQDRIFKKVLLYRHRGTNILGISPPPPRGANAPGISPPPPFRIFAPHICDVVYSDTFILLVP